MKVLALLFGVALTVAALLGIIAIAVGIVEILWRVAGRIIQAWKLKQVVQPTDIHTAASEFVQAETQVARKTYISAIDFKRAPAVEKDPLVLLVRRNGNQLLYFFGRNELRQTSHFTPLKMFAQPIPETVARRMQESHDFLENL